MRRAIDAQQAPLARILLDRRIAAGADIAIPLGTAETGGYRPGRRRPAIAAIDLAEARLAQPPAGGKERQRLEQICLPRPVGPAQHHRPVIGLDGSLFIAAEVADAQPGDMGPADGGTGEGRKGDDVGLGHHTRMGIST